MTESDAPHEWPVMERLRSAVSWLRPRRLRASTPQGAAEFRRRTSERYLRGDGIEIGALHVPLPTSPHARVRYVDVVPRAESLRRHAELAADSLVEVDIIDDGEQLATVPADSVDFIVANHFLEHTENPLGTIRNHLTKVAVGGCLFYALPDKRFTFDRDRPITDFDHLVRDDQEGPEWSRRGHYVEFARLVDRLEPEPAAAHAQTLMDMDNRIHFHVWDQDAIRELFERGRCYLKNVFRLLMVEPNHEEVLVVLRRTE